MPRNFKSHNTDPRHRYTAMARNARAPETVHELALCALLREEPPVARTEDVKGALPAVEAALLSYENDATRRLFDACILAKGTGEELRDTFSVSLEEYAAYSELFFDRSVFHNEFHAIAYIASTEDDRERQLLEEAFSKGFATLRAKYAPALELDASGTLEQIFRADAQQYLRERNVPVTHKASKDLRALHKSVVATAVALNKAAAPQHDHSDQEAQFVIESGPSNPTLDDLLAKGATIAQ